MTTDQLIQVGLGVIGFLALIIFKDIQSAIKTMTVSVEKLNLNVAVIVERVDSHEQRIGHLEQKS